MRQRLCKRIRCGGVSGRSAVVVLAGLLALLSARIFFGPNHVSSTPAISSPSTPLVTVMRVVDGDTVELTSGQLVRYIGINTPELRVRSHGRWRYAPEPFAEEAMQLNQQLVEGRLVRLEEDRQPIDRYGRRLAYLFVNDVFVNAELVRSGFAEVKLYPPNTRYQKELLAAQAMAQAHRVGRWEDVGDLPTGDE